MINQKKLHNKINNSYDINTTKTKTKTKQVLLVLNVLGSLLILTLSIFSVQTSLAQMLNENDTNRISTTDTNIISENTSSYTADNKKPIHVPNQIVIVAEDVEEIKDNLQKARQALNDANYLKVLSHIDNIDRLLTAFVISDSSIFVDNQTNNSDTNSNNTVDSTALAHLNDSYLIQKYDELISDYNKKYNEKTVIN